MFDKCDLFYQEVLARQQTLLKEAAHYNLVAEAKAKKNRVSKSSLKRKFASSLVRLGQKLGDEAGTVQV